MRRWPNGAGKRWRPSVTTLSGPWWRLLNGPSPSWNGRPPTPPSAARRGRWPSGTYLPSRITELTVHGFDVTTALSLELAAPPLALVESLRFVTGRLVKKGEGQAVLLALAGRTPLPPGLSAY